MTNSDIVSLDGKLLAAFLAAAEELHFGRAAARLFMTQPPFSQLIRRVEDVVGAPLFVRTTRSVRLTPAGQVMLDHVRGMADASARMLRDVRQAARGEGGALTVGLTPTAACSPLAERLYQFRKRYPSVDLELREMNSNQMEAALRLRSIDVALMRPMALDADIDVIEVFDEPLLLALRADHALASRKRIGLAQVADLPLIGYSPAVSPYFRRMLHGLFSCIGRRPRYVQDSVLPTVLTLVEAGAGAAIVPWTMTRSRGDALVFLPISGVGKARATIVMASLADSANAVVPKAQELLRSHRS
ncbi:LysR substrate-binding domain-containing protein [Pigmentiphaga litoralis]|uniref:LysR substrate-binding domain-containing protein n=1 Tax=Pigmentiphaga litoralis TaxID=516702 RepID=UPI003B436C8A